MKSDSLLSANVIWPPEYSSDAGENRIEPAIISGLTLPGLDLPEGTLPQSEEALRAHTNARIEILKHANLSRWHALWSAATASFRDACVDLRMANRRGRGLSEKLAEAGPPRAFRLLVLTLAAMAALACEYALSAPLIGPCFGFEPESWSSRCLGAIIVICTIALKVPCEWALRNMRSVGDSGNRALKTAAFLGESVLVCGMIWANYELVSSLAPLREEAGGVLHDPGTQGILGGDEPGGAAMDPKVRSAAVLLLGLVSVLDSLVLCMVVDREGRRAFLYWTLKRGLDRCRKQRAEALDRLRGARRLAKHWKFIWTNREDRLKAIAAAMTAREDCLRSVRMSGDPEHAPTAMEWVEQTLQSQHTRLPYVN
jgi:hypothetical protein